jgi:ABC-2 type transport system permease protein
MRASVAIARVTARQLLGGRRFMTLGLLGLLPAVVMWFASANVSPAAAFLRYHEAPLITILLVVMPVVTLILSAGALGDEGREQTLSFLLVRPIRRSTIVGAKLVTAWLCAALVVGAAGAGAATVLGVRAGDWSTMAPTLVAVAIGTAAYATVFLVTGHLTSRAVLIGLIFVFVWESGISFAVAQFANLSLFRIGLTAYTGMLPESVTLLADPLGSLTPGVGGAVAKVMVLAGLAVALGTWILRRGDATGE